MSFYSFASSVEDIVSVNPLNLDDEAEGLPAYEESVSSGLSSIGHDAAESSGTYGSSRGNSEETYRTRVEVTARKRISEKEYLRQQQLAADQPPSTAPCSTEKSDAKLPTYDSASSASSSQSHAPISRRYKPSAANRASELTRTGLLRIDFGSPFARHSVATVTCALSLLGGSLVLFGTADGLRVITANEEVPVRVVWTGLPVWDIRVLRCVGEEGKTPRGSVLLLCGGQEDATRPGKPRKGDVEVRVWKLGSLASLARWSAAQPSNYAGIEFAGPKKKDKLFSFGKKAAPPPPAPATPTSPLVKAWSEDYIVLPASSSSGGKSVDVICFATRVMDERVYIAIATSSYVFLHVGMTTASGFSFRSTRKFYLPMAPTQLGLLEFTDSLGLWIAFGSKAIVIRNSDAAVLDFKPPSGQGSGKGGTDWAGMQNVWINGNELYVFARGIETIVYAAPLELPISTPPVVHTTWPHYPLSSLVVPEGNDLLLLTTNPIGEICTQRAQPTRDGYQLAMQDGTMLGEGRILPLAWGYIRDGVYASVRDGKEWRICAIEKS